MNKVPDKVNMSRLLKNDNILTIPQNIDMTKLCDVRKTVRREEMDILDFLRLPPSPYQRNTKARAKTARVRTALSKYSREQLDVAIAELTQDAISDSGQFYPKGTRFINNGNTRAEYWKNCLYDIQGVNIPKSDKAPSIVFATIYPCKDMKEVRQNYETFDSPSAVERDAEKLAGILLNTHNYEGKFKTIKSGYFVSALGYACHCYDKETYSTPSTVKTPNFPGMVALFSKEIMYLGDNLTYNKFWDMPAIAGALMILKKHGLNNKKVIEFINALDNDMKTTNNKEPMDGVSHILEEWFKYEVFSDHMPSWDKPGFNGGKPINVGFNGTVSYFLYWFEKYMKGELGKKLGAGWQKTASSFFDDDLPGLSSALFDEDDESEVI